MALDEDSHDFHIRHRRLKYELEKNNMSELNSCGDEEEELFSATDTCELLRKDDTVETIVVSKESLWQTSVQMFVPFLLAGFGMVAASLLLDKVQHERVFKEVSEVYILIPALLGLKGNLEMTLASRLSTHANIGHFEDRKQKISLLSGNLALILCQAIVVGLLAAIGAVLLGWMLSGHINLRHGTLLCASSVVTAFAASFLLGVIMIGVILFSRYLNINPDNVATPIAASLGDLTTLACLSFLSIVFYRTIEHHLWLCVLSIIVSVLSVPAWAFIASRNEHTRMVLFTGWTPVIAAMVVSSLGGLIFDFTVNRYKGVAVFQLVINGVGGNLVAVQASRISTELHSRGKPGNLPGNQVCLSPCTVFCDSKRTTHAGTAWMLMFMAIPGHLIFSYTISFLQAGHTSFTPIFIVVYLTAALLQVFLLLYIAQVMILSMWRNGTDPDNSAIPYLTALGDLLGTFLLALAFQFLYVIGDRDSDVGD